MLIMHLGIDISVYQTDLTYRAIRAAGYEWAFIRITEGTSIKDGMCETHAKGCEAAGILWGGYQFFLPTDVVSTQVVYYTNLLSQLPKPQLPTMLDVETTDPLGWSHLASVSMECLRMIEEATGNPNGIYYCNESFARNLPGFPFTHNTGLDLAAPTSTPTGIPHIIRQLAPQRVPGCPTPVDVDEFIGTEAQWQQFTGQTPTQGGTMPKPTDVVATWTANDTADDGANYVNLHADGGLFGYGTITVGALTYVASANDGSRYHFGPKGYHATKVFSYPGLPLADRNVNFPTRYFVSITVLAYKGRQVSPF